MHIPGIDIAKEKCDVIRRCLALFGGSKLDSLLYRVIPGSRVIAAR